MYAIDYVNRKCVVQNFSRTKIKLSFFGKNRIFFSISRIFDPLRNARKRQRSGWNFFLSKKKKKTKQIIILYLRRSRTRNRSASVRRRTTVRTCKNLTNFQRRSGIGGDDATAAWRRDSVPTRGERATKRRVTTAPAAAKRPSANLAAAVVVRATASASSRDVCTWGAMGTDWVSNALPNPRAYLKGGLGAFVPDPWTF